MRLDPRGAAVAFAVALLGLSTGLWQGAALAGLAGGAMARTRPLLSAVSGTGAGWLLFLGAQMAGPGGRVSSALGTALGLPGGALVLLLLSLLVALALAALGAAVGVGLRGKEPGEREGAGRRFQPGVPLRRE